MLEQTTVEVLQARGLAERMDREGQLHDGTRVVWSGRNGSSSTWPDTPASSTTTGRSHSSNGYSETARRRVWGAVRLSCSPTTLLHRFPDASAFDRRAQEVELEYLKSSHQVALAEQNAGLPLEPAP